MFSDPKKRRKVCAAPAGSGSFTVSSVFSIPGDRNMRIRNCVRAPLKIKVDGVFCVFLDEGLARLDLLAH